MTKVRRARTTMSIQPLRLDGSEKFHSGHSMTRTSAASISAISASEWASDCTWSALRWLASVKLLPIQARSGTAVPVDRSRTIVVTEPLVRSASATRKSPSLRLSECSPRGLVWTRRIFMMSLSERCLEKNGLERGVLREQRAAGLLVELRLQHQLVLEPMGAPGGRAGGDLVVEALDVRIGREVRFAEGV